MLAEANGTRRGTPDTRGLRDGGLRQFLAVMLTERRQALVSLTQVLAHRRVNVVSLTVAAEAGGYRAVSAEIDVEHTDELDRIVKFLNRCVDVIKVVALDAETAHHRQAALIKITTTPQTRGQVVDVARAFRAEIVDVSMATTTLFCAAHPSRIQQLLEVLGPPCIKEVSATGVVAMLRGPRVIEIRARRDALR